MDVPIALHDENGVVETLPSNDMRLELKVRITARPRMKRNSSFLLVYTGFCFWLSHIGIVCTV